MTSEASTLLRHGIILRGLYTSRDPGGLYAPPVPAYVDEDSLTLEGPNGGPVSVNVLLAWLDDGGVPPTAEALAEHLCWATQHPIAAQKFSEPRSPMPANALNQ